MYPLAFGLGAAVLAMVGTNIGAGQIGRAVRIAWSAGALAAAATGIVGALAMVRPQVWISLFTSAPDVAGSAATFLGIAAAGYAFIGINTMTQAFQAMGQTLWPLLAVASRAVVMIVGGWIVLRTGGGVAGLAAVTALGLATAGGMVSTAYWIRMRGKTGASR